MKKFNVDGIEYELPDIASIVDNDVIQFRIEEGELKGIVFELKNMQMDEKEKEILHYEIYLSDEEKLDSVKPIAEALILRLLLDSIEDDKLNK